MKQQDWTEQLRDRLANHSQAAPEGLWARIEQQLDAGQLPRRRIVPLWAWFSAAAVAVILFVGGAYIYISEVGEVEPEVVASVQTNSMPLLAEEISEEKSEETLQTPPQTPPFERRVVPKGITAPHDEEVAPSTEVLPSDTPTESLATTADEKPTNTAAVAERSERTERVVQRTRDFDDLPAKSLHRRPLRASLMASNVLAYNARGANTVAPVYMSRSYMSNFAALVGYASSEMSSKMFAPQNTYYLSDYSDEAEHRMPLTVGFMLSVPLDDNWWLEGGVTYSRLSSTFTHRYGRTTLVDEQRLKYVGIPIGVGRSLWQTRQLHVYASADVAADFNVSAHVESYGMDYRLDKDRMQFSLAAHAGVEYRLLPWLGVYAQPGLKFYPDNGSSVKNIYKERPLDFDLQLGLRVSPW